MSTTLRTDVAIVGGGIAGLWLLNRLRQAGYHALLLEREALGAGQTRYAQGIIHGGTKYALSGKITGSSEAIAEMPGRWRACLDGHGELDLSGVRQLSDHQYLWSTQSLTSRMAGFFASKLMRSRTRPLQPAEYPPVFQNERFRGQIYRLDEPVLDTASLVEVLAARYPESLVAAKDIRLDPKAPTSLVVGDVQIEAQRLVLCAGKGNGELLEQLGRQRPAMQLRPLQMVMLRGDSLTGGIYAHCLGASANPRITITSHSDATGRTVWYLGGQVAEEGAGRAREEQIGAARRELEALLPWFDLSGCEWSTLVIERAEVLMSDGSRPDNVFAEEEQGVITAWPTKLALAPRLADRVLALLSAGSIEPQAGDASTLPRPVQARLPWQEEERWS